MPTMPPPTITTSPLAMREVLSSCKSRRSCQSARSKSTHRAGSRRVHEILGRPAVEVVLRHAALCELLPVVVLPGGEGTEQGVATDFLVAARVVDLVQLVPAAELGAHRVPQELHELDPLHGVDAARAPKVEIEILSEVRRLEVPRVRVQVDQAARHRF